MNYRLQIATLSCLLILLLTGCQKEIFDPNQPIITPVLPVITGDSNLLASYTTYDSSSVDGYLLNEACYFDYDSSKRLIAYKDSQFAGRTTQTLEYTHTNFQYQGNSRLPYSRIDQFRVPSTPSRNRTDTFYYQFDNQGRPLYCGPLKQPNTSQHLYKYAGDTLLFNKTNQVVTTANTQYLISGFNCYISALDSTLLSAGVYTYRYTSFQYNSQLNPLHLLFLYHLGKGQLGSRIDNDAPNTSRNLLITATEASYLSNNTFPVSTPHFYTYLFNSLGLPTAIYSDGNPGINGGDALKIKGVFKYRN